MTNLELMFLILEGLALIGAMVLIAIFYRSILK